MADRIARVVLQAVVTQYRDAMKGAAKDTEDLGKKTKATAEQSRQSMQTLGRGMMVGGAVVVAGFGAAVMASAKFEKQMSGVKAVSNATAAEMKQLSDAALKAGADTVFSASEAAQAEAELAKAGVAVKDIVGGALTGALSLAAAGSLELADAATISAQAMNIFKLQGKDVGHIADVLAAGANKSAADVKDLGDALRQSGLVAAQTGLDLEDTTGVLAAFADNALIGSDAGTALKTMLQRLTPQSKEAAQLMEQLGITAYDAQGNFVGLEKYADILQKGLSGLTTQQKNAALATIFGSDAVRAAAILYDQGAAGIHQYVAAVDDQGAAARMAATQLDNLAGDVEALKGSLETALIKSGSGANDMLRGLTQTATGAVNAFAGLPGPVQQGAVGLAGLAGAASLVGGAVMIGVGQVAKFKTALDTMGVSAERSGRMVRVAGFAMKGIGAAGAVVGLIAIIDQITRLGVESVKLGQLGEDLVDFAQQGRIAGELSRIAGADLKNLGEDIQIASRSIAGSFVNAFDDVTPQRIHQARESIDGLDQALVSLVQSGSAEMAAEVFQRFKAAAMQQGATIEDINARFSAYNDAVATHSANQKRGIEPTDGLTREIDEQAQASKDAAEALRAQASATAALFDPVFGVQEALARQAEAQAAVNKALREHGRNSVEFRQAQQDAWRATVDVDKAVRTMQAGVMDGSVSLQQIKDRLDAYVRAGLISADQARAFAGQLNSAFVNAQKLNGELDYLNGRRIKVTVDITNNGRLPGVASGGTRVAMASGGLVRGPGTGTSDSIPSLLSNGEYVVSAAATAKHRALLDLINGGGTFAPLSAIPRQNGRAGTSYGDIHVYNPTPEPASNLPRRLSELVFLNSGD